MASVNKITILGNVGKDPELRYLASGAAACELSVATTSKRKDKSTGETIEDTQWHRVKFFERQAEIVGEYVRKGHPIYVEGRIRYGKYTDQAGIEKNTCDIIAYELQLLGPRPEAGQQRQQAPAPRPTPAPRPAAAPRTAPRPASRFDDMDDDIPF